MKSKYKKIKEKADRVFSLYIRKKYEVDGYVECVTCGVKKPIKNIQAGHFIPRNKLATRYEETNVHPQCVVCNVFKKGNYPAYAEYLISRYGHWIIAELRVMSEKIVKWKVHDYEEKIKEWE